jgi:DNA mismatch repair protein MutS
MSATDTFPSPEPGPDNLVEGGPEDGGMRESDAAHERNGPRFRSVLFDGLAADGQLERRGQPGFFSDLNLDQLVGAILARKRQYELAPFFYAPLDDLDTIRFRQEIFADLERPEVHQLAAEFAKRELVTHSGYQRRAMSNDDRGFGHYHRARAFLNATLVYCDTVEQLAAGLEAVGARARGLLELRGYLDRYLTGRSFRSLCGEARALDEELGQVRYSFVLKGSRITVGPYDEQQPDYSAEVSASFERFQQGAVTSYLPDFNNWDAYEAIGVLHLVAKVYPDLFARLDAFCQQHAGYLDQTISVFDRELQFYLGYLEFIRPLHEAGLSFSYPQLSLDDKSEQALDTFDVVLAAQRVREGATVVGNDVRLDGAERTLVITGPNNGGKTTLARTIGQLHHLARLGCPVPGRDTRLFVCDQIFTHFERREDIATLAGKLQDELDRLHRALGAATPTSLFILNEMFNSTTAQDALFLSRQILSRVSDLDALCVCVTFLDEIATLNEKSVSMVSSVDPDDPAIRTYRVVRRPADGRAYARALAEKHGLTYPQLMQRNRP